MTKRIFFFAFAAALTWSTALVAAQEQAAAPVHKEGDTWQFNISRKGQVGSSTDQNDGIYELSVIQGAVKLYEVSGSQKNEISIQPDGASQGLLALIGKMEERPTLRFPLSVGQKWSYEYETRGRPSGSKKICRGQCCRHGAGDYTCRYF